MFDIFSFYLKLAFSTIAGIIVIYAAIYLYEGYEYKRNYRPAFYEDGICNVATINLSGILGIDSNHLQSEDQDQFSLTSKNGNLDNLLGKLDYAKTNPAINAIMLQVDSYGGYGSMPEIFSKYIENYPKPVLAYVRDAAASAAYWSISSSDYIVANRTSEVGSIGVTYSYLSNVEKNKKDGFKYIELNSGKYKDTGVPDKDLSVDELKYFQEKIEKFSEIFRLDVSKYRGLSTTTVASIADGRTFMGVDALEKGLVDEIGDEGVVLKWINKNVFFGEEKAILCYPAN